MRARGGIACDTIGAMIDQHLAYRGWCLRCRTGFAVDMAMLARHLGPDHSLARRTEILKAVLCPTCSQWSKVSLSCVYVGGKPSTIPESGSWKSAEEIPKPRRPRRGRRVYGRS